jgi:hypothetical protein
MKAQLAAHGVPKFLDGPPPTPATGFLGAIALAALLFVPAESRAQCPDWLAGPLGYQSTNGTNGWVYASTMWDPDGGGPLDPRLVVGGSFSEIEGVPAENIAVRNPSTGRWQALGAGVPTGVNALAVYDGQLVAGGAGDQEASDLDNNIVAWDGSAWQSFNGGTNTGFVHALFVYHGGLYVGGDFVIVPTGGNPANNIARWSPGEGKWQEVASGTTGPVNALAEYDDKLIVGGDFSHAGSVPCNSIAQWDGAGWNSVGMGMGEDGEVHALAVYQGLLHAGGWFQTADGIPTGGLAAWNGFTWASLDFQPFQGTVLALAVHQGDLAIGGVFGAFSGSPNITMWNGSYYYFPGSGGTSQDIRTLLSTGGMLYVGGLFTQAGWLEANHLAQWDGTTWLPFGGGTAGQVRAMAPYRGRLVVAGDFHQSAEPFTPVHCLGGWDGTKLNRYGTGMNGVVTALKSFKYPGFQGDFELIAGGNFTAAGGVAAERIARWDEDPIELFPPPAWQPMGAGFNSTVFAIERYGSATYAGGSFTASGGTGLNYVAGWNEATDVWEAVGGGMNGTVYALKVFNGELYAGGSFTTAGGVGTGGLARWNGSSWSQVGGFFLGNVYALEVHNGVLVMAGLFQGFGGSPNISSWTGSFYTNLGVGGTNAEVYSLHSASGRLYIGGEFTSAGGLSASRAAYWDGGAWNEPAGGADDAVYALAAYGGELHAGGWFGAVENGTLASPRWARYSATGAPAIASNPSPVSANPGDDVSFTIQPAPGYTGLSYQWYRFTTPLADGPSGSGSIVGGATTATLTLTDVTTTDAGQYWAAVSNGCGSDSSSVAGLTVGGATGVPGAGAGDRTVFEALGPNPSRGPSQITFSLARAAEVRVRVLDVSGRRVREIDMGHLPAGRHQATWDSRDDEGHPARAGVYFVGLETDGRLIGSKRLAVLH